MPILVIFYSFGYATGNLVGIVAGRKLDFGMMIFNVCSLRNGKEIADTLRRAGQPATIVTGEGMEGPVLELYLEDDSDGV